MMAFLNDYFQQFYGRTNQYVRALAKTFTLVLLFISCQTQEPQILVKELRGEVFGSYYFIKYRGEISEDDFRKELNVFFKNFNDEFSTYQKNSVISLFNQAPKNKKMVVSKEFIQMLELCKKFHLETEGAFEPTLAPVIKAWGFGGGEKKETDEVIKAARKKVGFHHIKWDSNRFEVWKDLDGVELDVNAFAPGWAADLVGEIFLKKNVTNFMVDISGEILFKGTKGDDLSWIGGIERPSKQYADGVHLAFKISNQALATSGDYRQFFDEKGTRKSHIIDPRSGAPVSHQISSASVIADSAAAADAWGTAMMVLGTEGLPLAEKHGKKVLLLNAQNSYTFSEILSPSMKSFLEAYKLK